MVEHIIKAALIPGAPLYEAIKAVAEGRAGEEGAIPQTLLDGAERRINDTLRYTSRDDPAEPDELAHDAFVGIVTRALYPESSCDPASSNP